MAKTKILAVPPYPELNALFKEAARDFPEIELEISPGPPERVIAYLQLFGSNMPDVIVSRGGYALALSKLIPVPVVDISFSSYDVIRLLESTKKLGNNFAAVGYKSFSEAFLQCKKILNMDFPVINCESRTDVKNAISSLKNSKVDYIIGDSSAHIEAINNGMLSFQAESSLDGVKDAFKRAIDISNSIKKSIQQFSFFKSVIDSSPDDVFIFTDQRKSIYEKHVFSLFETNSIRQFLEQFIDTVEEKKNISFSKRYRGYLMTGKACRINIGQDKFYVFYISFSSIPEAVDYVIHIENPQDISSYGNFMFNNPEYLNPLFPQLNKLAQSSLPILLYGSEGSGKTTVARYIHMHSSSRNSPFITIRCDLLTNEIWTTLTENTKSFIYGTGATIYFRNIHCLSRLLQNRIDSFLDDTMLARRNRIISSSIYNIKDMISAQKFSHSLYLHLFDASIYIPTLKERISELPIMIEGCINYYNRLYSKQVIGLEEDAINVVIEHISNLNFEQLQKLIKQLVVTTNNYYVTPKEVSYACRSVESSNENTSANQSLIFSGTLEEIEKTIINRVLFEENMNQTNAAKRLGISRSTLWRKQNSK